MNYVFVQLLDNKVFFSEILYRAEFRNSGMEKQHGKILIYR